MATATLPEVIDLSEDGLWSKPYFHDLLIRGLRADGFDVSLTSVLADQLSGGLATSYNDARAMVSKHVGDLPPATAARFTKMMSFLEDVILHNETCYQRDIPEKTRVIQWPNNPNARVNAPDHYFDIYQDYFYREPTRFITQDTPIGSAGSCFALRIAHQLQLWGYNYVIEEDDLPADMPLNCLTETSYRMAPARCGTLFNVPSMRQMVERAFGYWEPEKVIARHDGRIMDPFRSIAPLYQDPTGYLTDYHRHSEALRRALLQCEVFILTLGQTEAWYFAHSGAYTNIAPWKIEPSLLRRRNLTVADNVRELERLLEVYKRHRPDLKLIVSVSPVPLNKTFSQDQHVVVANCLSKSTLRVAAEEFVRNHSDCVYYFPAYEMVMYGAAHPWETDMRHVSAEAVARVMRLFQRMFLVEQEELPLSLHQPPAPPRRAKRTSLIRRVAGRLKRSLAGMVRA